MSTKNDADAETCCELMVDGVAPGRTISNFWPQTAEGRLLCLVLSLYAFAVFGYVTATLATFFIGRDDESVEAGDAENAEAEIAGADSLKALQEEIAALRQEVAAGRQEIRGLSGETEDTEGIRGSSVINILRQ